MVVRFYVADIGVLGQIGEYMSKETSQHTYQHTRANIRAFLVSRGLAHARGFDPHA
jgi:hypothetical protein